MRAIFVISFLVLLFVCVCEGWFSGRRTSSSRNSRSFRTSLTRAKSFGRRTYQRAKSFGRRTYQRAKSFGIRTYQKVKSINTKVGPFLSIRPRDNSGHRTGLGTLVKSPIKTYNALKDFTRNYNAMRKKNLIGGNLRAHENANRDATRTAGKNIAGAISALREQYKRYRVGYHKGDYNKGKITLQIGDTRTAKEIRDTMNANRKGRENPL